MDSIRAASVAGVALLIATYPSAALGATVTMPDQQGALHMTYTAAPGESNDVTLTISGDQIVLTQRGLTTPLTVAMMGNCSGVAGTDPKVVMCASAGVTQLDVTLGDGNDVVMNTTTFAMQASGEGGGDRIQGGDANDLLEGGSGPDTVGGGSGNDRIYGVTLRDPGAGSDSDVLAGGAGHDLLIASAGADRIDGGPGTDELHGGDGPDGLIGGDGDDVEDGGPGDDTVGALGVVQPSQELGNDLLLGGAGNDTLIPGPGPPFPDADGLGGGDGFDAVSYSTRMAPVSVDKNGVADDGGIGERDNVGLDVERIIGGLASDTLRGSPGPDALEGGPGDDSVAGLAGDDNLLGDAGPGAGTDTVSGGPGVDHLQGEGGDDALSGEEGNDTVEGGSGRDTLSGGPDSDRLVGGPERDVVTYGDDLPVTVRLDRGTGRTSQPGDQDTIAEVEDVSGGSRRDTLTGSDETNTVDGAAGEDYVDGLRGADRLDGGSSPDVVASRDRSRDETVSCGPGPDLAIVDRQDRALRRGPDRCEQIDDGTSTKPRPGRVYVEPQRCGGPEEEVGLGLPAMHRLVPLRYSIMLRSGYRRRRAPTLDAAACSVRLTATPGRGRSASARVSGGTVDVDQTSGRRVATVLTVERPRCGGATARNAGAAGRARGLRVNSGRRRGRWRVRGRYSIGASFGTDWRTIERCNSTTTIVRSGRVRVFDRTNRRTITVRAGDRYVARR